MRRAHHEDRPTPQVLHLGEGKGGVHVSVSRHEFPYLLGHLEASLHRERDHPLKDRPPERVQLELKRGCDAEVRARPAQAPEKV